MYVVKILKKLKIFAKIMNKYFDGKKCTIDSV